MTLTDEPHGELDELTLARARRGDRAAAAALVRRYERPVFALLSRMVAIDALRRRPREIPTAHMPDRPVAPQIEASLDRARLGAAMERAMLTLPEGQRAAFVLRVYHEQGYAEIAEALSVDVGTVKSRISRARAALKAALKAAGWEGL